MNRKLYTISEAAAMIDGLSEYRVRQKCRNGGELQRCTTQNAQK